MKRYIPSIVLIVNISLFFASNSFAQKEEIVWLTADFPPYVILGGPYKGMGNIDYMQRLVKNSLKKYKHMTVVANSKRIFHEIKNKDMVAYASALKSKEREKYAIFSVPYLLVLPNAVIVKKSKVKDIKPYMKRGHLFLDRSITHSDLLLGRSVGRAYGGVIDNILKRYNGHKNIHIYYKDLFKKSITELLKNNVDYIIGYPCEATYFTKEFKKEGSIVSIPVEGMPDYLLAYYAVPKTRWGRIVINRINAVLLKHRNSPKFHEYYGFWLDNLGKKLYLKYVKQYYNLSK